MATPFPAIVVLTDEQRKQREVLQRAGSTPQSLAFRARLVLRAAEPDHPCNLEVAAEFGCDRHPVATWRGRYLEQGLGACKTLRGRVGLGAFPPEAPLNVVTIATSKPSDYGVTATRWSSDDIAATILNRAHHEAMSRSTIWRILEDADLKRHKSVSWLNSHDSEFEPKA